MGNYFSCSLATPLMKNAKAARVVLPTGEIRQFRHPVKAAELMLECPNFFLANSSSLHLGKRFSALSADEDLEFGNVYIMFPIRRANNVVTAADMAALLMAANSASKRINGDGKVHVLNVDQSNGEVGIENSRSNCNSSEGPLARLGMDGVSELHTQYRLSSCRSRKPQLETISEEPILSR